MCSLDLCSWQKLKKIYLRLDIMIMMLLLLIIISNRSSSIVICITLSKKLLGSVFWAFWFGTARRIIPWWNYVLWWTGNLSRVYSCLSFGDC